MKEQHAGVPADTLAPLVVALGVTLLLFGVVTGVLVSLVGVVLAALGIARWIDELLGEGAER